MTKHRKVSKLPPEQAGTEAAQAVALAKPAAQSALPKLKPKKVQEEVKRPNAVMRFISFLKDARRELTRVTWPTRKETVQSTGVLLILVCISALYLFLVDSLINLVVLDGIREWLSVLVMKLSL
jgi:preprotein translocase subunit SecE